MIPKLILQQLDKEERSLVESDDHVRHLVRTSLPAFFRFDLFTPLSQHRRKLAPGPYRLVRIVAGCKASVFAPERGDWPFGKYGIKQWCTEQRQMEEHDEES